MDIRAATVAEVESGRGKWAYVDIGFAEGSRSSAIAIGAEQPTTLRFGDLVNAVVDACGRGNEPLHLLIEAPLSVAFSQRGTPSGRSIEKRNGLIPRYWYSGPGAAILLASHYLLRAVKDSAPNRQIRLVEGFASFKPKGTKSNHVGDVVTLRRIVQEHKGGHIVGPLHLLRRPTDRLECAFQVMGVDYGCPPVVVVDG